MMQIREISFTHLAGLRATIARDASPNRIEDRHSMELGTSASDSAVCPPSTDTPALV